MPEEKETHMVKIPRSEYEMLLKIRETLMRRGYQGLPPEVVNKAKIESFNRGAVVGLGLAALLHLLSKHKE